MVDNAYALKCNEQRTQDLVYWVRRALPGQTITRDYVFSNAPLHRIATNIQGTQRIINWCRKKLQERGEKNV